MSGDNPFDQFDAPPPSAAPAPATSANPFDAFDEKPADTQPAAPQRSLADQLGRSAGLTIRDLTEGALQPFALLADVPAYAYNKGADIVEGKNHGYRFPEQAQNISTWLTKAGLPEPETAAERVSGDIARGMSGAGTGLGIAGALEGAASPLVAKIGEALSEVPGRQVVSGAAGSGTSGALREAGAPGWLQTAGGVAASAVPFAGLEPTSTAPTVAPKESLLSQVVSMPSGIGARSVQEAYRAGKYGGDAAEIFKANQTGDVPLENVIDLAQSALGKLRAQRGEAYRSGMKDVAADKTVLSFDDIDKAVKSVGDIANYKGQDLNPEAAQARKNLQQIIDGWKKLDPAEYHTPEGMDALKQRLWNAQKSVPYGSPEEAVIKPVYQAVRKTIADQAPVYHGVMKGYEKASDTINDVQRTLSLNPKATPDQTLRKLQSVMRDNVNTNWGERAKLADILNDMSGGRLMPALAGQAARSWTPRGIQRALAAPEAAAMAILHPGTLPAATLASPRMVGNLAYGAGQAADVLGRTALTPTLNPGSLANEWEGGGDGAYDTRTMRPAAGMGFTRGGGIASAKRRGRGIVC